jgi:hypothetical protein
LSDLKECITRDSGDEKPATDRQCAFGEGNSWRTIWLDRVGLIVGTQDLPPYSDLLLGTRIGVSD